MPRRGWCSAIRKWLSVVRVGAAGHSRDGAGPGSWASGWTATCSISLQLVQRQRPLCVTKHSAEDAGSLFEYLYWVRRMLTQGHRKVVVMLVKMPLFTKPLRMAGLPGTEVLKASSATGVCTVLLAPVGNLSPLSLRWLFFQSVYLMAKYTR